MSKTPPPGKCFLKPHPPLSVLRFPIRFYLFVYVYACATRIAYLYSYLCFQVAVACRDPDLRDPVLSAVILTVILLGTETVTVTVILALILQP